VAAQSKAYMDEHWDRGFEFLSRRGCMPTLFCVALCCVGTGFEMGLSPV